MVPKRLTAFLLASGFGLLGVGDAVAAAPAQSIDFSRLTRPHNQMGFLHGRMGDWRVAGSNPAVISRAAELSPGLWRGVGASWSMNPMVARGMGASPVYVLSDLWETQAPNPKKWCNYRFWNRPLPFQNYQTWKTWVNQQARSLAAAQPSGSIWVDIWNEPDFPKFWPVKSMPKCYSNRLVDKDGSKYLNTFLLAERELRRVLGSRVKIIGPSTAGGSWQWTGKLLNFCARRGCRVDGIAWHLAGGTQRSVDKIGMYTSKLRRELVRNRAWRKASRGSRTPVMMTEYLPISVHTLPGAMVSYWYALEAAKVNASALTDWSDQGSRLNGLLTASGAPRSTWWAARIYAAGRAQRVATRTSDGTYSLLASRRGLSGKAEVLVGRNVGKRQSLVKLNLRGLGWAGMHGNTLRWRTRTLGSARGAMDDLPRASAWHVVRLSRGRASLAVRIAPGSAVLIELG